MANRSIFSLTKTLFNRPLAKARTNIKNFATHRFGQHFDYVDIDKAMARVAAIHLLCVILPAKAMGEGFDIVQTVDKKTEVVKDVTDKWDKDYFLPEIIRGVQNESGHGAVTFAFFKGRSGDAESLELCQFKPEYVGINVDDNGNIIELELTELIGSETRPEIVHHVDTPKKLLNTFHKVLRPSDIRYKGIPRCEKIWDIAYAHQIVLEAAMVGTVRAGYGLKQAIIHYRDDKGEMEKAERSIELGLANLDSGDTSIIVYSGIDPATKQTWTDEVKIDSGNVTFDYSEKIDICHKVLAFLTGLPKNFFDGIFSGETLAGDIIYRMIQSQLRELREEWTEELIPILKRWAELRSITWVDEWKIEWRMPTAKLTEKEEAEINFIEAQTQAVLKNAGLIDVVDGREALELSTKEIVPEAQPSIGVDVTGLGDKPEETASDEKPDPKIKPNSEGVTA